MYEISEPLNPRDMFDCLPEEKFNELRKMGHEMYELIQEYYDPHTCIVIDGLGVLTVRRDVLNTYV